MEKSAAEAMPIQIADPVIYKLVRVEGDGRLIPATDDEIMEVENMFEEEEIGAPSLSDGGQTEEHNLTGESLSVVSKTEDLEGKPQGMNTEIDAEKLNARLEGIGLMLQKVKQEEKLRLSSSSPDQSSNHMVVGSQSSDPTDKLSAEVEKFLMDHSLQEHDLPSPRSNDRCANQSGSMGACLQPTDSLEVGNISVSGSSYTSCSDSIPNFTKIKGEICLDKQTVRELQDTFKATFGRETSVKDKTWLKRRIVMGLSNSCDVSKTTTLVKDQVLVGKKDEKAHFKMECSNIMDHNMVYEGHSGSHMTPTIQAGDQQIASCKRLRKPKVEYDCKDVHVCTQQSAAKRVRKRTRRYIEELSEAKSTECDGRSLPSTSRQNNANLQSSSKSCVRPICDISTSGTVLVTRHDSLGGFSVQVPVVSRVRRGRPRESFMSIMQQCHSSTTEIKAGVVKKGSSVLVSHQDNKCGDVRSKDIASAKHTQQQVVAKRDQEDNLWKFLKEQEKQTLELDSMDSFDEDSDCNETLSTFRYGIRRKHHRPWTLGEIINLVEGVSKYGAGRWSEIKKVAFASYSYRTSVDLKDKWRNLIKASLAQVSNDNGMSNSRKPGSVPVPAPILLRVRQLAAKHSQGEPDINPGMFIGRSERRIHETQSGYL